MSFVNVAHATVSAERFAWFAEVNGRAQSLLTKTSPEPSAPVFAATRRPRWISVPPVNVFSRSSARSPVPRLTSFTGPEMTCENVSSTSLETTSVARAPVFTTAS